MTRCFICWKAVVVSTFKEGVQNWTGTLVGGTLHWIHEWSVAKTQKIMYSELPNGSPCSSCLTCRLLNPSKCFLLGTWKVYARLPCSETAMVLDMDGHSLWFLWILGDGLRISDQFDYKDSIIYFLWLSVRRKSVGYEGCSLSKVVFVNFLVCMLLRAYASVVCAIPDIILTTNFWCAPSQIWWPKTD